ncbi:MAG: MATE family efflux transporter [Rhizobiaceae bacterium]|nr:MATE family efflux transporter [Rhizobiaceae bacterium]
MTAIEAGRTAAGGLWRSEIRATLALAWPMVLTNLGQTAMTATDVMMMGRLGAHTLAAGTLGTNLYFAPMIFGLGLMLAAAPMMATEFGRKAHSVRDIRRTVRQGLWLAVSVSVPIWLILWNGEALLLAMGQEPDLAREAGTYIRWLQWSVLPFYGYIVLRSFISALERPGWALVIVFGAVAFNVLANWCLMFGNLGFPAMGIAGSGLATALSSTLMFIGMAAVVMLDRRFRRFRLFGRFWRPDWPRYGTLLRLGLPIAGLLLFEVGVFNAAAMLVGLISADALAAHAIAIQLSSITFMVPMGLGQAATVRVGRAYGAGDNEAVSRAGWTAFAMGVGFMAAMGLLMVLVPRVLIGAFIDLNVPENAPVIVLATAFLVYAALFQVFDGAQAVAAGMLRGLHDTSVPMIYAAIGYWGVGLPLAIVLAFHVGLGGIGVWMAMAISLFIVAGLLIHRWMRRDRLKPAGHRAVAAH